MGDCVTQYASSLEYLDVGTAKGCKGASTRKESVCTFYGILVIRKPVYKATTAPDDVVCYFIGPNLYQRTNTRVC